MTARPWNPVPVADDSGVQITGRVQNNIVHLQVHRTRAGGTQNLILTQQITITPAWGTGGTASVFNFPNANSTAAEVSGQLWGTVELEYPPGLPVRRFLKIHWDFSVTVRGNSVRSQSSERVIQLP
jgi:hypothetical protein